jgi:hypothetical protein
MQPALSRALRNRNLSRNGFDRKTDKFLADLRRRRLPIVDRNNTRISNNSRNIKYLMPFTLQFARG